MTRADNPMLIAAWKALYGYPYADALPAHRGELMAAQQRVQREQGDNFPNWVLDKLTASTWDAGSTRRAFAGCLTTTR